VGCRHQQGAVLPKEGASRNQAIPTLLFSEPAKSTKLIFPSRTFMPPVAGSTTRTRSVSVRTACEREEARLRRVAPTERRAVAVLLGAH
jgi:hypothetical protein